MSALELKVPPAVVGFFTVALMWLVSSLAPACRFAIPSRLAVAGFLASAGAAVCVLGIVSFRKARTTVNPTKPDTTSTLVVSGIYRLSRNPMYAGFLLILLACAVVLSNVLAFVCIPAFVLYMNRFQIGPEERALDSRFAREYAAYRSRVRRWL